MGMPITVEVVDATATQPMLDSAFRYFEYVDAKFSTYKEDSEISRINRGELVPELASDDMKSIFALAEQTRLETDGYFNIFHAGTYDPSGVVKGWSIFNAANLLHEQGAQNYYIDAGGDIQLAGLNSQGEQWRVGIRNPFKPDEIVSITLIGPDVCEADRYATAAFAMGRHGIFFVESLYGFEGYMIDRDGRATFTTGFDKYVLRT